MFKLIHKLRSRRKNGRDFGAADMIATLVMTPIILGVFFAIIDVSLFMNTKASVEAATRDGTRIAAMWGGTASNVRLNTTKKNVQTIIRSKIYDDKKKTCLNSHCTKAPKVTCTAASKMVKVAGTEISCTTTYYYKSIFFGSDLMGFGGITNNKNGFKSTSYAISETGYR